MVPEWQGEAGFGYDPVFLVPEVGLTFGQMDSATKHRWSHRGAAITGPAGERLAILIAADGGR